MDGVRGESLSGIEPPPGKPPASYHEPGAGRPEGPMNFPRITLALVATLVLAGCGTNPVTGKKEIQFVSEASELQIGAKEYAPTRQSQGGDFKVLPELTAYVNEVGPEARRRVRPAAALRVRRC